MSARSERACIDRLLSHDMGAHCALYVAAVERAIGPLNVDECRLVKIAHASDRSLVEIMDDIRLNRWRQELGRIA